MRNKDEIRSEQLRNIPEKVRGFYIKAFQGSKAVAVRAKCLECTGNVRKEITLCEVYTCPLFEVRPYQAKEQGTVTA